ncbi:28S ribosomal protein S28, mitochondrial [Pseudomyrmex gracilis]|uniref:28S ribosomal protein S28, mitochondrial n=1 Tax=Pseudomyrmex gracilis TaxID=219809 RepID=UPI000994E04B|nr:28S ribosomal protein S28, mitochondrial [Pseudomyrmex gracilis]
MNKIYSFKRILTQLRPLNGLRTNFVESNARYLSSDKNSEVETKDSSNAESDKIENEVKAETSKIEPKRSGFAQSYEKFTHLDDKQPQEAPQTFASLLRNSKFIDLGDPEGKLVTGKIFHVVGDDLYIDFGWKFYCVCKKPAKNGQYYVRRATVNLRIKELELSSKFLGADTEITLLEADCTLMRLIYSPVQAAERRTSRARIRNI